jgi:serine/threonine-protein kinase HipA
MLSVVHARGVVGSLSQAGQVLEFAYAAPWLAQERAFPLSPRLALREEPWEGEEVLFFFSNLLPEGPVLDALLQLRRLPRGNVYRQLEAFGRECAGAFAIVPEDEAAERPPEGSYREYPRQQLIEDLERLRENIPLLSSHAELRLSLAGAQNKIPVRYAEGQMWLPADGAPSTHILKPALQPARLFPDSVVNEAFCLKLAAELGLSVPDVVVLPDPEPMLLIERYDRRISGGQIERLHQLDMCQLAGVLPSQKYESDGGPGFRTCFELVDAWSMAPAVDRLRLVDWTLINYLFGNADAHAKNLSMLYGPDGRLHLAPAYDLLATGYWDQLSDKMAMRIGRERRPNFVHARHWQQFCDEIGLNPAQLRRRALDLCARARAKRDEIVTLLGVPAPLARHLAETLKKGSERIEQRLGVVA